MGSPVVHCDPGAGGGEGGINGGFFKPLFTDPEGQMRGPWQSR